jgi:hypothetical protein
VKPYIAAVALGLLLTAACGEDPAESGSTANDATVATTPRALAAIAAEYTGEPSVAHAEDDLAEEFRADAVIAELRFGADGEYDGDSLVLGVGRKLTKTLLGCADSASVSGCVELEGGGTLFWDEVEPEEDPGVVYLSVPKGDASVLMFYSGPAIEGDPRDAALPISVETMLAIATDPRVDLTTSAEAVAAGNDLGFWAD